MMMKTRRIRMRMMTRIQRRPNPLFPQRKSQSSQQPRLLRIQTQTMRMRRMRTTSSSLWTQTTLMMVRRLTLRRSCKLQPRKQRHHLPQLASLRRLPSSQFNNRPRSKERETRRSATERETRRARRASDHTGHSSSRFRRS